MNPDEYRAYLYLKGRGYKDVKFEPDGNIPPDFLVDGTIAIEVRRLNQNIDNNGVLQGFEQASMSLRQLIERSLPQFDAYYTGQSYIVRHYYKRPLPKSRELKPQIERALLNFAKNPTRQLSQLSIHENLSIHVFPYSSGQGHLFLMGGSMDSDEGGLVLHELEKNIKLCSQEKESKVALHRHKYSKWWLLLINHIYHALDDSHWQMFCEQTQITHSWDKLILINPSNPAHAFEI